jgi:hypothetical protein
MFNLSKGIPIAKCIGGQFDSSLIFLDKEEKEDWCDSDQDYDELGTVFSIDDGKLEPRLDPYERSVNYIGGPSGAGKSSYAATLVRAYVKLFPEKPFYLFSRTNAKDDRAFEGLRPIQITINESLLTNPIDITKELQGGSILLFDDCNTIQNEALKKNIDKLMADIMEVGRKLDITIIITNHLIIPNEKKIARTIMNEMQSLTFFPKAGAAQQVTYALKTYFGLFPKQINEIMQLQSRWVTINKKYPNYVLYDHGCFIL